VRLRPLLLLLLLERLLRAMLLLRGRLGREVRERRAS
jgi:hypothetical protein